MTATSNPEDEFVLRPARETASEIAALSGAMIVALAAIVALVGSATGDVDGLLAWLRAAGKVLYAQLGWTLGLYVTALVAFYAVSIGGQVLGGGEAVARTRRILGAVAEVMAALTVPVVLLVGVYCWYSPPVWAVLFVLLPVVGVVFFLAIQLGAFLVADRETRIAESAKLRSWSLQRTGVLRLRSRRSFWLVWLVNGVVIAAVALLVSLPGIELGSAPLLWVLYFALTATLLGVNAFTAYTSRVSTDRFSAGAVWVLPAILYLVAGAVGVTVMNARPGGSVVGWVILGVIAATLATTFWPRRRAPRLVLDWSVQGAVARLAAASVTKTYARATREYLDLTDEPDEPAEPAEPPRPGILQRLRTALGRTSSSPIPPPASRARRSSSRPPSSSS